MSVQIRDLMAVDSLRPFIPDCCHKCRYYSPSIDGDWPECRAGVWFPNNKRTCKRQSPKREAQP